MTYKRKYIPFMYIAFMALTIILISWTVNTVSAYFTSTSRKQGEISFHTVELEISSTNPDSNLFTVNTVVVPGETVDFSHVSVSNTGSADIYSLVNLNVYIQRAGYTAENLTLWHNLDGEDVDYKTISSNTTDATMLSSGETKTLDLSYEFNPYFYDNTYQNATVKISIKAVGIQSANIEEINGITEEPLIASYMLINDFHIPKADNIVDLNQITTSQASLSCSTPSEKLVTPSATYSLYNFNVENANPGDTIYVQAANADQVAIIPGTYDLSSLDINNLPAGTVQEYGQAVTTFTVPEQTTYLSTKSVRPLSNVLPYDWDGTFTVCTISSISSKKPIVRVYTTPQDDLPDIVDGLGVYQINYLNLKTQASTFTIPMESYGGFDVSNYIVSNITENTKITVYAYDAVLSCIMLNNRGLKEVIGYINAGELPPNSVVRGYVAVMNGQDSDKPCVISIDVPAGSTLKFCVAGMTNFNEVEYEPKVSVYVTPTGNLPFVNNDIAYQLLEDGTGYSAFAAHDFVQTANILSSINNKSVKEIREYGFSYCPYLYSVSIPSSVQTIGDMAFSGCVFTKIEIPSSVQIIKERTFYNCTNLNQVTFGANSQLKIIDDDAFSGCESLTEMEIPSSVHTIGYFAFSTCTNLNQVTFGANSQLKTIYGEAFYGCASLKEIEIPASVEILGGSAFYNCTNLSQVTFGANSQLKTIGNSAFSGCASLTEIEIPASVQTIGHYAFSTCANLNEITLNAQVGFTWAVYEGETTNKLVKCVDELEMSELITYAKGFYNFKQVPDGFAKLIFTLSNDGTYYIVSDVKNEFITHVLIPAEYKNKPVKEIGDYAFYDCNNLSQVTFGANSQLKTIGKYAFYYGDLTEIEIPATVQTIGNYAFSDCNNLSQVTFGANSQLQTIESDAFFGCTSLTEIEIPASVQTIGRSAFNGCTNLRQVTFGENSQLQTIVHSAFSGCTSLREIEIPSSVQAIGETVFVGCINLSNLEVEEGNKKYHSEGNCIIETATDILIVGCKNSVIPNYVTTIGDYAFATCTSLREIEIPASVHTIGVSAFYDCRNLSQVTFGANSQLQKIGNWAFSGCALTEIEIPSSVQTIGHYAFRDCTNLNEITLNVQVGYVWAVYEGETTNTLVKYVDEIEMSELITYAKGNYNFKQVLKSE